ncbi:MAG: hypothetical protein IRY91_04715 [Gemmatimonadaceae bacterium]|nr:hypothetical protein [Gemmatimonadaceae bacterium]
MIDLALETRGLRIARAARPFARCASAALAAALIATACSTNEILDVKDPDVATSASTQTEAALGTVLNGAIGDFHAAYGGTGDNNESSGEIGYGGLLSDEIKSSDTFPTRTEIDERHIQLTNGNVATQFLFIERARASADRAALRFATFAPDSAGHALAYSLSGMSMIMLAENWCSGVPISTLTDDGELQFGQPETTKQLLQRAQAMFDSAITVATTAGNDAYLNLARVGKGRALLDQGQFAEAAAAVADVPDDFVYFDFASANTTAENNGLWSFFQNTRRLSVADREGGNGLPYISANDPRVPVQVTGRAGFDGKTSLDLPLLYPDRTSPIPVATGIEARLIEAEAALQAGTDNTFVAKLNAARAAAVALANSESGGNGTLPAIAAAPATEDAKVDLLFSERAFDLFLTSHRLGDMRRLVGMYGRDPETVFATGLYFKDSSPMGTDVNLPVPITEQNNPNFTQCLNRDAWNLN